jgi:DNA-binding transcriptional MocR family regulator
MERDMKRVDALAAGLRDQMESGLLAAGGRLPSVREHAALHKVSPTTMVEAYELLKQEGRIEARARSGYFVLPPQATLSLPERGFSFIPSASLAPDDLLHDMLAAGNDDRIFPFGAAVPRPSFYPTQKLRRLMTQVLRDDPALIGAYRFMPGSLALRQTLARHYQQLGVKVQPAAIVTTTGAIEAVGLALGAVAAPGATIGVETPTYPGIFHLVRALGYRILELPIDATRGLTPEVLETGIQRARGKLQAVVTTPNFSNPLGTLVTDADKQALVDIATRAGVALIEDDINGDLGFTGQRPRPLKAFDRHDTVLLCTSFTKTISASLRCGCVINAQHASTLSALKYARGSGISALTEAVLQRFLDQGYYQRHLVKVRSEFRQLLARYSQEILQLFPSGTCLSQPQGGFILWVELPHAIDGAILQKQALQKRISVAPGSIFSEGGGQYRNSIRLNCAIPWSVAAHKALAQLARLIRDQQP